MVKNQKDQVARQKQNQGTLLPFNSFPPFLPPVTTCDATTENEQLFQGFSTAAAEAPHPQPTRCKIKQSFSTFKTPVLLLICALMQHLERLSMTTAEAECANFLEFPPLLSSG